MPRKEARLFTSIWQDGDFIALAPEAQRMYFLLLSQPELSHCGLLTLAENRWAKSAEGMTKARVRADLKALASAQPRPFVLVDYGTDEVLIRSFIRRDHVLRGPKLIRPLVAAVRLVRSPELRRALRDELQAAQGGDPMCSAAVDAVEQMIKLLSQVNTISDGVLTLPSHQSALPHSTTNESFAQVNTPADRAQEIGDRSSFTTGTTDYLERPEIDRLCNRLADAIAANGSRRPPVGKAWRDSCRLMIDRDGLEESQIARAIDWCQADEFWRANVLSMPTLRRQYDKLRLAAKRGNRTGIDRPSVSPRDEHMMRR